MLDVLLRIEDRQSATEQACQQVVPALPAWKWLRHLSDTADNLPQLRLYVAHRRQPGRRVVSEAGQHGAAYGR